MEQYLYIEKPIALEPDTEPELPYKKNIDGLYQLLPNSKFIGGKNALRDLAKNNVSEGYVYLIKIHDTNKYKIGVSTVPKKRLSAIASVIPFELMVLALNKIKHPFEFEQTIIDKFRNKLIKNEWFELTIEEAKAIMINLHNKQITDYANATD